MRSGGEGVKPEEPSDDDGPYDAEGRLLSELWRHLDHAEQLSILPKALQNLDEIARCCEAVIALIHAWRTEQAGNASRPGP